MYTSNIEKDGNLLVLESMATVDTPLESSLMKVLGNNYADSIKTLLKNTRKQDLVHITETEIQSHGFTARAAKKVSAIIQFAISLQKLPEGQYFTIRSPHDAATIMSYLQNETQEHFVVMFLNVKAQMIAKKTIFIGTLDKTTVHPREVMKEAIKLSCHSMILCHNHPSSGNPSPSQEDIFMTKRLIATGEIVGIPVIDHIIIGD